MPTLYVISPPREIFEGIRPEVRQHIVMLPDFLRYPSGRFKGITRSLLAGRIPCPSESYIIGSRRNTSTGLSMPRRAMPF